MALWGRVGSQDLFNGQSRVDLPNIRRISDFTYISVWQGRRMRPVVLSPNAYLSDVHRLLPMQRARDVEQLLPHLFFADHPGREVSFIGQIFVIS